MCYLSLMQDPNKVQKTNEENCDIIMLSITSSHHLDTFFKQYWRAEVNVLTSFLSHSIFMY